MGSLRIDDGLRSAGMARQCRRRVGGHHRASAIETTDHAPGQQNTEMLPKSFFSRVDIRQMNINQGFFSRAQSRSQPDQASSMRTASEGQGATQHWA
jgi:hypothetical protein